MLREATHWLAIAGTAVDALLLLRILLLRLHRTYLFITLACLLSVFFDGVQLWLGADSREFGRVFIYSRFLYAFIFPAAAADVWEEIKPLISKIRRVAIFRLGSSLLLAALFGLLVASFAGNDENAGSEPVTATFAVVLWAAASTASLAFLWSMHRMTRVQKIELPGNTFVWLLFWELSLAAEVVQCFLVIILPLFRNDLADVFDLVLGSYGIGITLWCVWRLRALPTNMPSAPEQISA